LRIKIHLIFGLILLTFLLNGCWVYYPQIAGVSLPSEKGDLDVTGSFSPLSGFTFLNHIQQVIIYLYMSMKI